MPQLRLVVLALQDAAGLRADVRGGDGRACSARTPGAPRRLRAGAGPPGTAAAPTAPGQTVPQAGGAAAGAVTLTPAAQALIDQAARDLADYQRLTAEGKLGEAGLKLESLKKTLERLKKER